MISKFVSAANHLVFAGLFFVLSSAIAAAGEPMRLVVHPEVLVVKNATNETKAEFAIEIARTELQRNAGLMHRVDLPLDRAMLFVFQEEDLRYFWMHNTPTSLDIIYAADDGTIVSIANDTKPFSIDAIPSGKPAMYVLEVHAGLSAKFEIVPGDRLIHPQISAAE